MPVGQIICEDKMFFSEIEHDNIENWTAYTGNVNENNPMQDLIELFTLKNSSVFMDRAYEIIDVGRFANYFADAAITKKLIYFRITTGSILILKTFYSRYFLGMNMNIFMV